MNFPPDFRPTLTADNISDSKITPNYTPVESHDGLEEAYILCDGGNFIPLDPLWLGLIKDGNNAHYIGVLADDRDYFVPAGETKKILNLVGGHSLNRQDNGILLGPYNVDEVRQFIMIANTVSRQLHNRAMAGPQLSP